MREVGETPDPTRGRRLLGPGFPGDSGEPDARLTAALTAYGSDRSRYADTLAALQDARLLVPVVAVLGEAEVDERGLARDKTSDMATVLLRGADGRTALLAFSGLPTLHAWDPEARPVPVASRLAAQAALQDGAAAMVVDLAGPVRLVVEGEDLQALASGWTLTKVGERSAWIRPTAE